MIVIFVVVLVVFGPQKLPELARGLGKLMADLRRASTDFKIAFEEEMRDIERQARETERKKAADAAAASAAAYAESQPAALPAPAPSAEEPAVVPPTVRASEESVPREPEPAIAPADTETPASGPAASPLKSHDQPA